jgi:succinate dehydrogenase/fumarate reductase cytochrome b subunit
VRLKIPQKSQEGGASFVPLFERLPVLSCYAKTRGWYYVTSWLHRFTGIGLFIALMVSTVAFPSWRTPNVFNTDARIPSQPFFVFLAWATSLVVSFHALNGGRLILYELFGRRNDASMMRWVFGLSAAYASTVALLILMESRRVPAFFFWGVAFFLGAVAAGVVRSRLCRKRHSVLWKLQRITGAFLFVTAPAYVLFLCLNPHAADGTNGAILRMQDVFTQLTLLTMTTSALYHAGYGLFSIAADYASPGITRTGMTALIVILVALLAVLAFRFVLFV